MDRFHQLSTLFRQHHTTAKLHLYYSIYIAHDRVPTVMEKHRKKSCHGKSVILTPYFQFEKRFDFLFVYVMNTCDYFLCLPSWHHGNGVNCDGKSWKSHGILLSVFCGNPVYNVRVGTIHRCIDISRYQCHAIRIAIHLAIILI